MTNQDPIKQRRAEAMLSHCGSCSNYNGGHHGPWDNYACGGDFTIVMKWAKSVMAGEFNLEILALEDPYDTCPERKVRIMSDHNTDPDISEETMRKVENWFTYHSPTPDQLPKYKEI